jgi:general secretion pathway protein M
MTSVAILKKTFANSPLLAAGAYAALVVVLLFTIVTSISDIFDQRAAVVASTTMLEQLEGHGSAARGASPDVRMPAGSAFLEGATVTVAGAALLQRVAEAVAKRGGNVLSSQVDLQGPQAKAGFISMIASCEIEQADLQPLVYDIEAGMPFLFIDQLEVQAPATQSASEGGKLRILLAVSGQWQGAK